MKKKILALCLVVVLAVTAVTGATLAYFSDTEQATNTMVIGNVEINIEEYVYENGAFAPFVDDQFTLYPLDNAEGDANVKNKIVHTFNTSDSEDDVYIRTIVLFEANALLAADEEYAPEADCCMPGLHYSYQKDTGKEPAHSSDGHDYYGAVSYLLDETVNIGGTEYWVVVFEEAQGRAIPHDAALYTMAGVWMDKNVKSEHIAGWGEDKKVDIIVFSQGIQAEGLTHGEAMEALGDVAENIASWIGEDDAVINDLNYKG